MCERYVCVQCLADIVGPECLVSGINQERVDYRQIALFFIQCLIELLLEVEQYRIDRYHFRVSRTTHF